MIRSSLWISILFWVVLGSSIDNANAQDDFRLERLKSFAKVYGYARYFHPSDQGSLLDWDKFAIHGANRIVNSSDDEKTEDILIELFNPIIVDLEFYRGEQKPLPETDESVPADEIVAWQHYGLGFGSAQSLYKSERTNRQVKVDLPAAGFGNLMQGVPAAELQGKDVRYRFKAKIVEGDCRLQGWLRVDRETGGSGLFDNMGDRPIRDEDWDEYEITGTVDADAKLMIWGAFLIGSGSALIDDVSIEVKEDGEWKLLEIENGDFEANADSPDGWVSAGDGFRFEIDPEDAAQGELAMRISRGSVSKKGGFLNLMPKMGEVVDANIGGDLRVRMPLTLHIEHQYDSDGRDPFAILTKRLRRIQALDAENKTLACGNVIILWNVFQHFYPYFPQVETDWPDVLDDCLDLALQSETREETTAIFRWLVAQLHDGHGNVIDAAEFKNRRFIKVEFGWVEDQLVVVRTEDDRLEVGDIVETINGDTAESYLTQSEMFISGSPQWKRYRALNQISSQPLGTKFALKINRDGQSRDIEIAFAGTKPITPPQFEKVKVIEGEQPDEKIYYVNLGECEPGDVRPLINDFAKAKGIVLDLRGYPRGTQFLFQHMTDEHIQSQQWQVPKQIRPDRVDIVEIETTGRWEMPPQKPRFQGKMIFITDESAISYAESCMAIVANYKLGEIIGSPTAGANGNINPFTLPGAWRIVWTGMRVMNHDDSQHHVRGVQPTIPMRPTIEGIISGKDELLEKALMLIREN